MNSPGKEVPTEDIPIIPNPNAPSETELKALWEDAVKDISSKPQKGLAHKPMDRT